MSRDEWANFVMMMEPIGQECLCVEGPWEGHEDPTRRDIDSVSSHSDYCPVYLYAYAKGLAEGGATLT